MSAYRKGLSFWRVFWGGPKNGDRRTVDFLVVGYERSALCTVKSPDSLELPPRFAEWHEQRITNGY